MLQIDLIEIKNNKWIDVNSLKPSDSQFIVWVFDKWGVSNAFYWMYTEWIWIKYWIPVDPHPNIPKPR